MDQMFLTDLQIWNAYRATLQITKQQLNKYKNQSISIFLADHSSIKQKSTASETTQMPELNRFPLKKILFKILCVCVFVCGYVKECRCLWGKMHSIPSAAGVRVAVSCPVWCWEPNTGLLQAAAKPLFGPGAMHS